MNRDFLDLLRPSFAKYSPVYYKKGQIIINPEDKLDHLFFIEKGYVKFYTISSEGKELTFLIYKPGYLFPLIYTFLGKNTQYYFEALTPVVLRKATRDLLMETVTKNANLLFLMIQEMMVRFEEVLQRMELLKYGSAGQNVVYILHFYASQFGIKKGKSICISLPLTHKEIASMLGLTRETVSIEMKKLQQEGVISYKRNLVIIKNSEKLFNKQNAFSFDKDYPMI